LKHKSSAILSETISQWRLDFLD